MMHHPRILEFLLSDSLIVRHPRSEKLCYPDYLNTWRFLSALRLQQMCFKTNTRSEFFSLQDLFSEWRCFRICLMIFFTFLLAFLSALVLIYDHPNPFSDQIGRYSNEIRYFQAKFDTFYFKLGTLIKIRHHSKREPDISCGRFNILQIRTGVFQIKAALSVKVNAENFVLIFFNYYSSSSKRLTKSSQLSNLLSPYWHCAQLLLSSLLCTQ